MLCEYQRFKPGIVAKRVYPTQTGWSHDLYWVEGLPAHLKNYLEEVLFFRVDQDAANGLDALHAGKLPDTPALATSWSRFLMSLLHRQPAKIARYWSMAIERFDASIEDYRPEYEKIPNSLQPFDEYIVQERDVYIANLFVRVLQNAVDSANIGEHLNNMHKGVISINDSRRFMTSDDPLHMPMGLSHADAYLTIPIGPKKLFVAANKLENVEKISNKLRTDDHLLDQMNADVVARARQFAYGVCDNHVPLVDQFMKPL
jgi:hypothetical protein